MMNKTLSALILSVLCGTAVYSASAAPQAAASAAASAPQTAAASAPAEAAASDPAAGQTQAGNVPEINAAAYLVSDLQGGQILAAENLDMPIEPASFVKLMTAYLTFKSMAAGQLKAEQMMVPSDNAWRAEGSRMFLTAGKAVSVGDLLKGMIVQSGNDAALTLAEGISGSEQAFVKRMNEEAARLGMKNTHFMNATGKPVDGQFTTLRDLSLLADALIRDFPVYYKSLYSMKAFKYNNIEQPNRNLLLYRDSSVDGLAVGQTAAGYHMIASSNRDGRRVLAIVAGAPSIEARAAETGKLINWALQGFQTTKVYDADSPLSSIRVYKGQSDSVNLGFIEPVYLAIPESESKNIKPVLETVRPVIAPVQAGQVLGKLTIMYNGKVLAEKNVVALSTVEEAGFFGRLWDSLVLWWNSTFG